MVYMSESKYTAKMQKIKQHNLSKERKRMLREERMKYWPKFILPSTSKIVLIVAAFLCVEILIFCQYMIVKTGDSNALYAMVGVVVSLSSVVLGYFVKSTKENTVGGITFETAIKQKEEAATKELEEAVG